LSALEVFCCYAHEDRDILDDLKKHLMSLQRQGRIDVWNDADINPGRNWEEEIKQHLNTAHIILLLVSPDFMASDYCYSKEMLRAMERHNQGEASVIPIIVRPVYWQIAPFGKLQALPKDAQPIKSSSWYSADEAFLCTIKGFLTVIEKLKQPQRKNHDAEQDKNEQEAVNTKKVIRTGFQDLDRLAGGFRSEDLIIIAGMSLSGKSSLALNIASFASVKGNYAACIVSLREKKEYIFQHLLSLNSDISYQSLINDEIDAGGWESIVSVTDEIQKGNIWSYDPPTVTIPELRVHLMELLQKTTIDLVIIDSVDFILKEENTLSKRYIANQQDAEELSFYLKALARELNAPIIALARMEYKVTQVGKMLKDP
jgi:archaellum biogenesis ATPase FlaH